jgi:hypothetical protein
VREITLADGVTEVYKTKMSIFHVPTRQCVLRNNLHSAAGEQFQDHAVEVITDPDTGEQTRWLRVSEELKYEGIEVLGLQENW